MEAIAAAIRLFYEAGAPWAYFCQPTGFAFDFPDDSLAFNQ
jgi:hypothetical protein